LIEALHGGLPKIGGWVEVEKKLVAGSRWIGGCKDLFRRDPELLDDNEEAGHRCEDSPHGLQEQMQDMISNWVQQASK